ncbi:hypothetical protein GQ53DRAFT_50858 [Thozetella sp. PMI_491]|nr:hypothetical protein GQ53DRAFT_50858 [Thozetella sp. PMI_491]
MASNVFRIFNPNGRKEDRTEKRRAQLRQAQQTYRDRKDRYAKSLEGEVARGKSTESKLRREAQGLRGIVQTLLSFIDQQGIEIPDEIRRNADSCLWPSESTSPAYSSPDPFTPNYQEAPRLPGSQSHGGLNEGFDGNRQAASSSGVLEIGAWLGPPGVRLSDLDPVIVGMEFVLTLEEPCLGHLHGDPDKPEAPSGHALTASSQLLAVSPTSSLQSRKSPLQSPPAFPSPISSPGSLGAEDIVQVHATKDMLASLLRLAPELCSDYEVTPVQAWSHIRQQPYFGGLEMRTLQLLARSLRDTVKCHGFGAVVTQDVFQKCLGNTLSFGRPF